MNLLSIAQLTYNRCGLQGSLDTTEGISGIGQNLVEYVKAAYVEIQLFREEWKFRQQTLYHAVDGTTNTAEDDTVSKWLSIIYDYSTLQYIPYENYLLRELTSGKPWAYTIVPESNQVILNPLDSAYIISSRSIMVAQEMEYNTDIPIVPTQFHRLIAFKAAQNFAGGYLSSPEIEDTNAVAYDTMLGQMMRMSNPGKSMSAKPLV